MAEIGRSTTSAADVISAVAASGILGVLVGGASALAILGFGYWADVPDLKRGTWVFVPAVGIGTAMAFYLFWFFISGEMTAKELWGKIGDFFTGVRELPP